MAWDDPIVWVLIIAAVIFLFGANQIPKFAKSLGQARREFAVAMNGANSSSSMQSGSASSGTSSGTTDDLLAAAQKEGIETTGKSREQVASELSWKLNKS